VYTRAKHKLIAGYKKSVIRRTVLQSAIIVPGFFANFLIYFFSGRLLNGNEFGFFYVALTIGNVLFSGALILNVFFTRYLVLVLQAAGEGAVFHAMLKLEKLVIKTGLVLSIAIYAVLSIAANYIGVQSRLLILLIVLDAFTAYVADLARVLFQTLGYSTRLGLYTTMWMVLKLALCIGAIWMFNTVWAGLLGQIASAVFMFACFRLWTTASGSSETVSVPPLPAAASLLAPVTGYSLMIVVSNMDVLASYFLLSAHDLSIYSASSVFPKAILVVITPLLQMLFPMMVGVGALSRDVKVVIGKTVGITMILTLIGVFIIWLFSGWLCGGTWGLRLCEDAPLFTLLLSAVPVAMLRVLVMLQFARRRDMLTLWLAVPILLYIPFAWTSDHTIMGIAQGFAYASTTTLLLYLSIYLCTELGIKRSLVKSA